MASRGPAQVPDASGDRELSWPILPVPARRRVGEEHIGKQLVNKNWISTSHCLACFAAVLLLLVVGCVSPDSPSANSAAVSEAAGSKDVAGKTLVVRWQRLLDTGGSTCDRCGETERSVDEAHRLLAASLKPLGIHVSLVKAQLSPERFKLDPGESNRIWIAEQPLETILGAKSGMSRCGGCCGDSACRTTVVDGRTYETIPPELIVRAGLKAAADLVQPRLAAGTEQFWRITWNPFATKGPWCYLQQQGACGGR